MDINNSERLINRVLEFWFEQIPPALWWKKDPQFDAEINMHFSQLLNAAKLGECWQWRKTAQGRLAEIIVLDQFSRNIFRDTPQAFEADSIALALAQEAISNGSLQQLPPQQTAFMLMPFMHSESLMIHQQAITLFEQYAPDNLAFEIKHMDIIQQFGRYPHRNDILKRQSTADELAFLQQPGSSF